MLSIGAGLIATFGLVSDNTAVVIGAMVVAPWILPLRTAVFAILVGDWGLLLRASRTLSIGVASTVLAVALGLWAGGRGLLLAETMPAEISGRVNPNLIDLAIALVAGAMATYAKVKPSAVSSMAGTAIAVVGSACLRDGADDRREVIGRTPKVPVCCSPPTCSGF